ncbi:MAG TPA: hypothetical protein VGL22_20300 [Terracidiphilus sp.]|jgi:hypothetical protein
MTGVVPDLSPGVLNNMGITEVVNGTLRGMGCEADCVLLVSRDERQARHCTILQVPDEVPDGYYEVRFRKQTAFLRRRDGLWGTGIAWAEIPARKRTAHPEPFVAQWMRTLAG